MQSSVQCHAEGMIPCQTLSKILELDMVAVFSIRQCLMTLHQLGDEIHQLSAVVFGAGNGESQRVEFFMFFEVYGDEAHADAFST